MIISNMKNFLVIASLLLLGLHSNARYVPKGVEAWSNLLPKSPRPKKTSSRGTTATTMKQSDRQPTKSRFSPPPHPPSFFESDENTLFLPPAIDNMLPDVNMEIPNPITPKLWNTATSSLLSLAASLAPKQIQKRSSPKAARLTINSLPPQSVEIDLQDVPLVGKALSGTYVKTKTTSQAKKPSIQIASPKDKLGAIQEAADTGNLQFGLDGLFQPSLDIQLQPNQPGVAPIELKSPLIPKLPFGKRTSDWNKVTNIGNGQVYYFNAKTGESQFEEPNET